MATNRDIEWTDQTWNPTTGCDMVSSGCKFCYAEKLSKRIKAMGRARYEDEFAFRMQEEQDRRTSIMAKAQKGLREFDERSVP